MDPYYIYAFQHNPGDSCNLGSRMEFGLEILRQYGCKLKHKEPILKCDSPVDKDYISNNKAEDPILLILLMHWSFPSKTSKLNYLKRT